MENIANARPCFVLTCTYSGNYKPTRSDFHRPCGLNQIEYPRTWRKAGARLEHRIFN